MINKVVVQSDATPFYSNNDKITRLDTNIERHRQF